MAKNEGLHIVFLPFPLEGHISPCLAVARLLGAKGLRCTFIVPQERVPKLGVREGEEEAMEVIGIEAKESGPSASASASVFASVSRLDIVKEAHKLMDSMKQGVEELLQKWASLENKSLCLISDCFVNWSLPLAKQLNIPRFALFTGNASVFSLMLHTPLLLSKGFLPLQDPKQIIDCLPGMPTLPVGALPSLILSRPHELTAQMLMELPETAGFIFNTCYLMEDHALKIIKMQVPIYPIGPLPLMGHIPATSLGLRHEEKSCLQWLDTMPPSSVLYVSFGSLVTMGPMELVELAEGLEASSHAFLWVIRPNATTDSKRECLPMGFEERTRSKGLIIPWAPQKEVLSHPGVGGFLTHCGWNSIVESFSLGGIPMICWPHMADQKCNARLVVDQWKIGLDLEEGDNAGVKREVVERVVREVMNGEQGIEMRKRALQLKAQAIIGVQEGGSSFAYLEALVQDLERLASKQGLKKQVCD